MAPAWPRGSPGLRRRDVLKGITAAGVGTLTGAGVYGFLYERLDIEVTHATLRVAGWAPELAGLRIGLITDFHRSETVPHDLVARAVRLLMAERPDLIVLGGDYISFGDRGFAVPAANALAGLEAPWGVFAILGNHDDDHDVPAALAARGFAVLRDARTEIRVRGERVDLVGIRFWTRRRDEIARLLRGAAPQTVLLAHNPTRLLEAASLGVPLVLSGHTHGGQIVLPGLGAVAARKFPLVSGIGTRQTTTIFVSRGIGTVYVPVRWNCPPEVAVLTIHPRTGDSAATSP